MASICVSEAITQESGSRFRVCGRGRESDLSISGCPGLQGRNKQAGCSCKIPIGPCSFAQLPAIKTHFSAQYRACCRLPNLGIDTMQVEG